jgi:ABC-type transport system substrate-binding protein
LLRSGSVHWIDRPNVQQVLDLRADKRVKVEGTDGRAMMSVRMNSAMKPFDDVRVRQAFNFGVDQGKLMQSILGGTGQTAKSILPPIVADYDPSLFAYGFDPAKGRALLAAAGHPDGIAAELLFSDMNWWEEQVAVQVADQLKSIGCTITPRHITATEISARAAPGKQDMAFFTYEDGPIVLDPVYTLALMADSKGVSNRCRYSDPKLDALVLQGLTSLDGAARDTAMKQAQKIWMDDVPWILTCYPQFFEAMAPNVSGWVPHPDDHERWVDLRIS